MWIKIAFITLIGISPILLNAQSVDFEKATDSVLVLGILRKGSFIGEEFELSGSYSSEYVGSDVVVPILSVKRGESRSTRTSSYEVLYNGKPYFASVPDLATEKDNFFIMYDWNAETATKYRTFAVSEGGIFNAREEVEYQQALDKALKWVESTRLHGIALIEHAVYDESEYTDGTGIRFSILNTGKKTIKYITFNFTGYNAVDDRVSEQGKFMLSARGIGPIEPNDVGSYEFEYVWMSDIIKYSKINSIRIQYMDESIKTITAIPAILMPFEHKSVLQD